MLTLIRTIARNPFFGGIIIALLIAAFALWGINDIFRGTGTSAVIVGSQHVSVQDLQRSYDRQLFQIQMENPRFTREQAEEVGLPESVVQRITAEAAVDAKANELGLSISDQELLDAVLSIPAFQNPFTNEFDPQTYISILRDNGYSGPQVERQFENDMVQEMRRNQYISAVIGGLRAPSIYADIRSAYAGERRSMRALLLPTSLLEEPTLPEDTVLADFIAENSTFFQRPEQRRLTLVKIQANELLRDVEIDEAELQELYDYRLENGELSDPATRSLTQWPVADQTAAEAAAERLTNGDDLSSVQTELGLGDEVVLADMQAFQIPDSNVADAAFDMAQGEFRAVEGQLGWRVIRIDAALDPETPSFESLETELRQELAGDTADGLMLDALAAFEEARATGATIEEAANVSGLIAERLDYATANGYTVDGEPVIALLQYQEIAEAAFQAPIGFATDLQEFGENGYFVLRVDAIEEARLAELDEVREQAEQFWLTRERDDQLQVLVDQALERVNAGDSLESIAADLGSNASVEAAILNRTETAGPFSAQLVAQAFRAPLNTAIATRAEDQSVRAIVLVDQVIPGDLNTLTPVERSNLNDELNNDAAQVLTTALLNAYEVRADQRLIDQALGRVDPNQQ